MLSQLPDFLIQLWIVTMATVAALQPPPRIDLHPVDTAALSGATLRLECKASGGAGSSQQQQQPVIVWHSASSGRPVPGGIGPILEFRGFDASHVGRYYCNASAIDGRGGGTGSWTASRSAWARLASLGRKFALDPTSRTVASGQVAELSCRPPPTAVPPPRITWHRNGRPLSVGTGLADYDDQDVGRFRVLSDIDGGGVRLRIYNARPSDSGEFACVASNEAGELHSASAVLTVVGNNGGGGGGRPRDPPMAIRLAPVELTVAPGDPAAFNCWAEGQRATSITWRRADGVAMDIERIVDHGNGTLIFRRVALEDAGRYICEAASRTSSDSAAAILSVLTDSPPKILAGPADLAVPIGGRAVLNCRTVGKPAPTVYWSKNNAVYLFHGVAGDDSDMTVGQDGRLTIYPVRQRHQGRYKCHATNQFGTDDASATLTVQEPGAANPAPPVLIQGPQSQTVLRGRTLVLPCRLEAGDWPGQSGPPRIVWTKNGRRLETSLNGRQHVGLDGSLQVFELRPADSGNYTCLAELDDRRVVCWPLPARVRVVNLDAGEIRQQPPSPPPPPASVGVVDRGVGWALLSVIGGGGCRRLVEWDCGSGWTTSFAWHRLAESSLIRIDTGAGDMGLAEPAECRFLARSVCPTTTRGDDGFGVVSRPSLVSPAVRLLPPTLASSLTKEAERAVLRIEDFRAEALDNETIRVRWRLQHPANTRVRVRAVCRRVRLADCLTSWSNAPLKRTAPPSQPVAELCSLSEPDALAELLRDYSVAQETSGASSDLGSDAKVAFADAGNGQAEASLKLGGLAAFTCYEVVLTPIVGRDGDEFGGGTVGSRLVLTGDSEPILAPVSVSARWHDNGSLQVSWLPPPLAGRRGAITGYQVKILDRRLGQPSDAASTVFVDGAGVRSVLIASPLPSSGGSASIGVRVAARNCRGVGPESPELPAPTSANKDDTGDNSSALAILPRASWLIGAVAAGGALWLGLAVVVACALRRALRIRKRRRMQQRRPQLLPPTQPPLPPPLLDSKPASAAPQLDLPPLPLAPPPPPPPPAPPRSTAGPFCRAPPDLLAVATSASSVVPAASASGASSSASPYASASVVHSFMRDSGHEGDCVHHQAYRCQQQLTQSADGDWMNCREFHFHQASCQSRADADSACSEYSDEPEDNRDFDEAAVEADVDDVASVAADDIAKRRRHQQQAVRHQQQRRPLLTGGDSSADSPRSSAANGCRQCCQKEAPTFGQDDRRRRRKARRQTDRPLPAPPPTTLTTTKFSSAAFRHEIA